MMDEFDLEVAPLEPPTAAESGPPERPAPNLVPFAPRLSPRARVVRAGGILGVLLLAVAVLVAVTPAARSAVVGFVFGPTPTATASLDLGRDRIAVENQVPWGTLTIDGRPKPQIVPSQVGTISNLPQLQSFRVARGRHHVEYRADPFPPLQCTLSVPAAPGDTCPLDPQAKEVFPFADSAFPQLRLLDLRETVDRLPAGEATRLADAAQQALDLAVGVASATLVPGDHYGDDRGRVQVAGEALTAVPAYALEREYVIDQRRGGCAGLCQTASPFAQSSADAWLVYGDVLVSWRYTDAGGHVVLADGLSASAEFGSLPATIQMGVRRVGSGWQVRLLPPIASNTDVQDLPLCDVATLYLDALRGNLDPGTGNPTGAVYRWSASSSLAEFGCVFGGGTTDSQGNLIGPVALVLYRCGILLAVNTAAQQVFPHLPVASAHERALALAARPPTASSVGPGG
jgi:hypothetical protein